MKIARLKHLSWKIAGECTMKMNKLLENDKEHKVITFGRYPQNSADLEENIEWLVLKEDENTMLLISEFVIDSISCENIGQYLSEEKNFLWETCEIRKWLNTSFYNNAFNDIEKERIIENEIENKPNPEYGTGGGENTIDKVFLLSIEEAEKYFKFDDSRKARATRYAEMHGAVNLGEEKYSRWHLRSSGDSEYTVAYVSACELDFWGDAIPETGGDIFTYGDYIDTCELRPVIHIKKL